MSKDKLSSISLEAILHIPLNFFLMDLQGVIQEIEKGNSRDYCLGFQKAWTLRMLGL